MRAGAALKITNWLAVGAVCFGIFMGAIGQMTRSPAALSCRGPAQALARLEMLFGMMRPDASIVGEEEWANFLDEEVTPRFPAGLTVLHGAGQWRGQGRPVKEQSKILVIWHEPTSRTEADIEEIRSAYRTRFHQDSVLRVDSLSCVSF